MCSNLSIRLGCTHRIVLVIQYITFAFLIGIKGFDIVLIVGLWLPNKVSLRINVPHEVPRIRASEHVQLLIVVQLVVEIHLLLFLTFKLGEECIVAGRVAFKSIQKVKTD